MCQSIGKAEDRERITKLFEKNIIVKRPTNISKAKPLHTRDANNLKPGGDHEESDIDNDIDEMVN